MQLSDSFFPSGSFTLSHGLESLIYSGQLKSPDDFQEFLRLLLSHKVGPSDLVALIHAYRASVADNLEEVRRADLQLFAQTLVQEAREAQRKSGRALLMVARSTWADSQLESLSVYAATGKIQCVHPVVFAVVGRAACLTESDTVLAFLHSFLTNLCGAAIRLGVLGHLRSQLILKTIASEVEVVANQAASMDLEHMWSCTPSIDIAQMSHQQLPQKLFTN
jgi:urease accessory protein